MRVTKRAPQKFHFIGICGTAMGSVAAALQERGFKVSGSDESVYPPMSIFLEERGIELHQGYAKENIPADADVVVIGNAMKRGNPEVEAVLNRKLFYLSLPEVLKNYFLRGKHNLVVTGTHGKTTTTSLKWRKIVSPRWSRSVSRRTARNGSAMSLIRLMARDSNSARTFTNFRSSASLTCATQRWLRPQRDFTTFRKRRSTTR